MKKLCTLAIGLLVLIQFCSAQGVKQLWTNTGGIGKFYSIDTATFTVTERNASAPAENGAGFLIDYKLIDGKIFATTFDDWFLYEFDPMKTTDNFSGNVLIYPFPPEVGVFFNGNVRNITRKGNNLYIVNNQSINTAYDPEDPSYYVAESPVISKWNMATREFSKLMTDDFFSPIGSLVEFNNQFYGLKRGNPNEIFEWDPDNATITRTRSLPAGSTLLLTSYFSDHKNPTVFGNKLYILAFEHILEWDPATNILEIKHSFDVNNDPLSEPVEGARFSLIESNGKLYGMTAGRGTDDKGVIFEYDPVTENYAVKVNFAGFGMSGFEVNSLFYDEDSGEIFAFQGGKILQFNPASNKITAKDLLSPIYGQTHLFPALVSLFTTNTCTSFTPVTVDGSNNNSWVPVVDDKGDVLAELHPHGNNLGTVNIEAYIHEGAIRKDGRGQPYLDRTITINPQNTSIADPVELRLYITRAEFEALKADPGSGINDITDLAIFKSSDACSGGLITSALPIPTTYENYEFGYVLKASVSSFTTFYFSNRTFEALPLQFIDFTAIQKGSDALVGWTTENEINTKDFVVERSIDGIQFVSLGTVAANNTAGKHSYSFTDKVIDQLNTTIVYYRLKQRDADGRFEYSKTISIRLNSSVLLKVNPNPAGNVINVSYKMKSGSNTTLQIIDAGGKKVLEQKLSSQALIHKINIQSLSRGVYMLSVTDNGERLTTRFIKQ